MIIDGILLLDKSTGITSNSALQRVRHLFKADKAGHTGCLDPLASGMLPICFGEATKFSRFFIEENKSYSVEIALGTTTTTGDREGAVIEQRPVEDYADDQIIKMLAHFQGTQTQIPPMYSAIKHNGQPLYKLARRGIEVPRKSRTIIVHELTLNQRNEKSLRLTVCCSKGTYIRTLAEQMGNYLGCGAHVSYLHRLWVAPFQDYPMLTLNELVDYKDYARTQILSLPAILEMMLPTIVLGATDTLKISRGQTVPLAQAHEAAGWVSLLSDEGDLLGVGEIADDKVIPKRILSKVAIAAMAST
jgi:tRNA pseudouridine55 synthase